MTPPVGGFGTRLRPLTFSKPKPLIEFANKPILWHQVKALAEVGVKEVILAINYQPGDMLGYMKELEEEFSIKVTPSIESVPLGTAGPIRLAKEILMKEGGDDDFFVFNSDIICQFPLKKMLEYHKSKKAEGTLMVTQIEDPSRYGVILFKEDGEITDFIEKPSKPVSNKINAGLYLLNKAIIDKIPERPTSIEREIFPMIAKTGKLYAMELEGIWMDIGKPCDMLKAVELYTGYVSKFSPFEKRENFVGNVIVHPKAKISPTAMIGPNVVVGEDCEIEEGVRLKNAIVFQGTKVGAHSFVSESLIGWKSSIGRWCRLEGLCVIGEDVKVKDEVHLNGTIVCPNKAVAESQRVAQTILL